MNKKFKKLLFFSLVALFIISVPATILYSQGYRFDFTKREIVQTGGFYFKVNPAGVKIFLENGQPIKTNFFSDGTFISGLLPKTYQIIIEKDGYHSWNKELTVEERMVTESKNIILFPTDPKFNFLFKDSSKIFPHPKSKDFVVKNEFVFQPSGSKENSLWNLEYFDFQRQEKNKIAEEQDLKAFLPIEKGRYSLDFSNVQWVPNQKKALIETIFQGEKKYFLSDFSSQKTSISLLNIPNQSNSVLINPKNPKEIFFLGLATSANSQAKNQEIVKKRAIFALQNVNGNQNILPMPTPSGDQEVIVFSIIEDNIFWMTDLGLLYQGKIIQGKIELIEVLNKKPYPMNPNLHYQLIIKNPSRAMLKENKTVYYLNPETRIFEKAFESVKEIRFSEDLRKIAMRTDYQIWVLFLDQHLEQPRRVVGEKILLSAFENYIDNIFWLNNHYLIFQEKNVIKIAEIDNRSKVNIIDITSFPGLKLFWNGAEKMLLAFSQGAVYYSTDILK